MHNILVLGAGQSAGTLIRYLLDHGEEGDWIVTVADRDPELAARQVGGHPRGTTVSFDIHDGATRTAQIGRAEVVVNLLPQAFQSLVAWDCLQQARHLVSVSYRDRAFADLEGDALRQGVLLLAEVGLDPGIDLMSAASLIAGMRARGGQVESFESYGSGVPADPSINPFHYCITWNPRNVVMAGEEGAQYVQDGEIKIVPWHHLFEASWPIEVEGVGTMEAYPNRDSLSYRETLGIPETRTLIRGTLRYPGWSETWHQIVRLGLPNEHVRIPDLGARSPREVVAMFLPHGVPGSTLEQQVARYLQISPTGRILENLRWLGLFSNEPLGIVGATAAELLVHLLRNRLALPPDGRDLIILQHRIEARFPDEEDRLEVVTSTLTERGEPGGPTAMARTVGLPAGIAVRLLLEGRLPLTGCHVPTHPLVYEPVLEELEREGIRFTERWS